MRLTIAINLAEQTAALVEKHALSAGDTYNPLVLDFSSFDQSTLAAIGTSSLELVIYKSQSDTTVVASTNAFTKPNGQDKLRTSTLLMNQQAMLDWYNSAGAGLKEAYIVISDSTTTYASCAVPVILRPFTVGSGSNGYYTSSQVDALLAAYQKTLTATAPLSLSAAAALSIAKATASALGVVKPGSGLSIDGNGELTVQFPSADDAFDDDSDNAIANSVVSTAVSGIITRLDSILKNTSGTETGRLKAVETTLAEKADADDLATVATTGSYNDLTDKPTIPGSASAPKWITGTGVTGTSVTQSVFSTSGVATAVAGDMYLNTATGNVYSCGLGGDAETATWGYAGCIKGTKGDTGDAASTTVYASYETVAAMDSAYSSDSVPSNGLVVITTGTDRGKMYRKGVTAYEFVVQLKGDTGSTGRTPDWLSGTVVTGTNTEGASFSVVASVGDMYLNTSTAGVYRCTAAEDSVSTWVYVCSIRGETGSSVSFLSGSAITASSGSVNATVSGAKVGDVYLTSAGNLFKCESLNNNGTSSWSFVMTLKGSDGDDGDDGDDGTAGSAFLSGNAITASSGSVTAVVSDAKVGDVYLTSAGNLFKCGSVSGESSVWTFVIGLHGTNGTDGTVFLSGTEVASAGTSSVTLATPKAGDVYFNTSTKDMFRCGSYDTTSHEGYWTLIASLTGITGPASAVPGCVPTWTGTDALGGGYSVLTSLPLSAAAGTNAFLTASAIYNALQDVRGDMVSAPASHTAGNVPLWASGESLTSGLSLRTSVRDSSTASDTALVTEKAIRTLVGETAGSVQGPDSTTSGKIPYWSATDRTLTDGYTFRSTDAVRATSTASTTTIPSEKSVRLALTALETNLTSKRIDEFAAAQDNTTLNASTSAHGLLPKLDGVASHFLNGLGQFASPTDISSFSGTVAGLVPQSSGGTSTFLRADGSWAAPTASDYTLDVHGLTSGSAGTSTDEIPVYDGTDVKKKTVQQILSVPTYDVYFVQAGAFAPSKTNGATVTPLEFTNVTHDVVQFASGTRDQSAEFDVAFPDDWDGSEVKVRILWTPYAGTGSTGDWVRFQIGAKSFKEGDSVSQTVSSFVTVDDQMINTGVLHKTVASAAISFTSSDIGEGNLVHFVMKRDADWHPSGGNALAADASVLGVQIQFKRGCDFAGWITGA